MEVQRQQLQAAVEQMEAALKDPVQVEFVLLLIDIMQNFGRVRTMWRSTSSTGISTLAAWKPWAKKTPWCTTFYRLML